MNGERLPRCINRCNFAQLTASSKAKCVRILRTNYNPSSDSSSGINIINLYELM